MIVMTPEAGEPEIAAVRAKRPGSPLALPSTSELLACALLFAVAGPISRGADLHIGVTHTPATHVLDAMAAETA